MIGKRTSLRLATGIALVSVLAVISGCGGGGDDTTSTGNATGGGTVPRAVATQANGNCQELVLQAKRLATGVVQRYQHSFQSLTAIVSQGIPIVERIANRQRALAPDAHSAAYDRYVALFDPIIVLLQDRIRAGTSQDPAQALRLNGLVTGLSVEQKQAARSAGLSGCEVDFPDIVTQAAYGVG